MAKFSKGDRVMVFDIPAWLQVRVERGYCTIKTGMIGNVIGYASTGKVCVEFDQDIFKLNPQTFERSSFDNGCHGKGSIGKCAYFYEGDLSQVVAEIDKNRHCCW